MFTVIPSAKRAMIALLSMAVLLAALPAAAAPRNTNDLPEPYRIPTPNPGDISAIRDVTGGSASSWSGEIHQDLSQRAMCGGWDMDDTVNGKIATVIGVPGRYGDPLGNIPSGMALRDEMSGVLQDGFVFPGIDDVRGWSTACGPGFPPYLDDGPPCKDPVRDPSCTQSTPQWCQELCPAINRWQVPIWVVIYPAPYPFPSCPCVQFGKSEQPFNRDPYYGDACFQDGDGTGRPPSCAPPAPLCSAVYGPNVLPNPFAPLNPALQGPNIPSDAACLFWIPPAPCTPTSTPRVIFAGWYYACTGAVTTQLGYEACTLDTPATCVAHADPRRNCVRCEGDGVPIPSNPATDWNGESIARGAGSREETGCRGGYGAQAAGGTLVPGQFISYFRDYTAGYSRDAVDEAPQDVAERDDIPVACYGFYDEFDPKTKATSTRDARCVIAAYKQPYEFREFYHTQLGRGNFGQEKKYPDPDPTDARELRNTGFQSSKDLWYPNLGGGFSLLNGGPFKEKYEQDMTLALLNLDTTLERARGPMLKSSAASAASSGRPKDYYESLRSPGALIRAFDDTVSNDRGFTRTIAEWWQQQESEAYDLVHPAVAHMIFPSTWSVNLNLHHPLLSPSLPSSFASSSSNVLSASSAISIAPGAYFDPRRGTIEVQAELSEDLLGEVASFLEQVLLFPVVERPMSIAVQLGSPSDFRAYKEGWIRWKLTRENAGDPVSPDAQILIDRLEEYAVSMDEARKLRSQLPKTLAEMLKRQTDVTQAIHDWLESSLQDFRDFQQQRQLREQLAYEWRNVQSVYSTFHDLTNMPWCKNDRFTTSIYSLLDPWMPGRPDLDGDTFPRLSVDRPEDVMIDLTALEAMRRPILIPVLKPVQVLSSDKVLQPPHVADKEPFIPVLPPLYPLPDTSDIVANLPNVTIGDSIAVTYPDVSIPTDAQSILSQMRNLILGMDREYKQFWDAVTKPRCGTLEATKRCAGSDPTKGDCCVIAGEEEYCRRGWDNDTCVHVEMDLIERFTRMGARPAVLMAEDFKAMGQWRSAGAGSSAFPPCDPADWSCLDLHRNRIESRIGWFTETKSSSQENWVSGLRTRMFRDSLQRPSAASSSLYPFEVHRNQITPSFDVRKETDLSPTPSSASASASASSTSSL